MVRLLDVRGAVSRAVIIFVACVISMFAMALCMPSHAYARSTPHTDAERTVNLPGVHSSATLSSWTPLNAGGDGTWTYESSSDSVYEAYNVGLSGFYNPTANYGKMQVWLDLKSPDGDDDFMGIMFRTKATTGSNMSTYMFVLSGKGADGGDGWVWPDGQPTDKAVHNASGLYKITNTPWSVGSPKLLKLTSTPHLTFSHGDYKHIDVQVDGGHIVITYDGKKEIDYTDPNPIDTGSYGFWNYSQGQTSFKNIGGRVVRAEYKVNYNANGNGATLSTGGSTYTSYEVSTWRYDTSPTPTRTGYDFAGWYTDPVGGENFTSKLSGTVDIANDITLYAHWTPHTYTIAFDGNTNTGGSTANLPMTYDVAKALPGCGYTKHRHTFTNWNSKADGSGTAYLAGQQVSNLTATQGATVTLFAQWERDYGYIDLQKASSLTGVTNSNGSYSLAGASYGVYSDRACTDLVGTLTTDASGHTNALHIPTEVYYVKETTSPDTYMYNPTVYEYEVYKNATTTVAATDAPRYAPGGPIAQKLDSVGMSPQGDATMSGGRVAVAYLGPSATGTAVRKWVFSTDADGGTHYDADHKVSGDDLYVDGEGNPIMPLGVYSVTESAPPDGYRLTDTAVHQFTVVTSDAASGASASSGSWNVSGTSSTFAGRGIVDEVKRGGVVIWKVDAEQTARQGSAVLSGATYEVVNMSEKPVYVDGQRYVRGSVCKTVVTDDAGKAEVPADSLPYGSYLVREKDASTGYLVNEDWSATFEVRADGSVADLSSSACPENVQRGGLRVLLVDSSAGENPQGDATLAGAKFQVVNKNSEPVIVNGTTYASGAVVAEIETDEAGVATLDDNVLPYGNYEVSQSAPPEGYDVSTDVKGFNIRFDTYVADLRFDTFADDVDRGGVSIRKVDADRTAKQGDAALSNATYEIVNMSDAPVYVDGRSYDVGKVCKTIVTGDDGIAATDANCLPYGSYTVREKAPSAGYLVNTSWSADFSVRDDGVVVDLTDDACSEAVMRCGLRIQLADITSGESWPQGDAKLEGAKFQVVNRSAEPVVVGGVEYLPGQVVAEMFTDEDGGASLDVGVLPYGSYEVYQATAPEGYYISDAVKSFKVRTDGGFVDLRFDVFYDDVERSSIKLRRCDSVIGDTPQGDASFNGAVYQVVNRSEMPVIIAGTTYGKGEVCYTLLTGADGTAITGEIFPAGTYEVREKSPSTGYDANTADTRTFTVSEGGKLIDMTRDPFECNVSRGGFTLQKRDADGTDQSGPAGYAGFTIEVRNDSANSVQVNGTVCNPGQVVGCYGADASGHLAIPDDALPVGRYSFREVAAPGGYTLDPTWCPFAVS